jgi:glycerophosphoryl diester phosphodiesterase
MTQQQLDIWRKLTAESESNLEARIKYDKYMEEQVQSAFEERRLPTFGEQLVGLEPDVQHEDEDVQKVKELMAQIAEILKRRYSTDAKVPVKSLLFDHAVGEILNAQMAVVKVITLK